MFQTFVLMLTMVGSCRVRLPDRRHMGGLIGLSLAFIINLYAYWYSDRIVLRLYNARPRRTTSS